MIKLRPGKRYLVLGSFFIVTLAVALSAIWWIYKDYLDPGEVFWSTIDNNLATKGVTKQATQKTGTTQNLNLTQLIFSPTPKVHYFKEITESSTSPATVLALEGITTLKDDYQHYARIERPGVARQDFSELYGLWLKNVSGNQSSADIFNNAMLGPVLFGNLNRPERRGVTDELKKAYTVFFVEKKSGSGGWEYNYEVTINLKKYALAVRHYARLVGLPGADKIASDSYQDSDKLEFIMTVDALAHQLKSIQNLTADTTEGYSGYGIATELKIPARTATYQQFQEALGKIAN